MQHYPVFHLICVSLVRFALLLQLLNLIFLILGYQLIFSVAIPQSLDLLEQQLVLLLQIFILLLKNMLDCFIVIVCFFVHVCFRRLNLWWFSRAKGRHTQFIGVVGAEAGITGVRFVSRRTGVRLVGEIGLIEFRTHLRRIILMIIGDSLGFRRS